MNLRFLIPGFFRPEESVDLRTSDNRLIAKLADEIELLGATNEDITYVDDVATVYWLNRKKLMPWLDKNAVGLGYEVRGTRAGNVIMCGEAVQPCAEVVPFVRPIEPEQSDRHY